jgi:hypothetical protein
MNTIKRDEVGEFLRSLKGKFFTIEFTKRTTGEHRVMRCSTNYDKQLAGGELAYSPSAKNLFIVWSLDAQGFRSIPLEGVKVIRALGDEYEVSA